MTLTGSYPWDYFMSIPTEDACITLLEGKKRRNDELLFTRWVNSHSDYEMSFEDFKRQLTPRPKKSKKAILDEVNGYITQFSNGIKKVDLF